MSSCTLLRQKNFLLLKSVLLRLQIAEKLELLLTEREGLYATWEDHKTELDQAYDLHVFLRDAKQIDTLTSSQEVSSFLSLIDMYCKIGLFLNYQLLLFCPCFNPLSPEGFPIDE